MTLGDVRRISVTATFVVDQVVDTIDWWLRELRPGTRVRQAAYGQVLESLRDPASVLNTDSDVNVVLLRLEDFVRNADTGRLQLDERADHAVAELADGLRAASSSAGALWLVCLLPPSARSERQPDVAAWLADTAKRLTGAVEACQGVRLVDVDGVVALYQVTQVHDEYADVIGHLPYTDEYLVALGTWLARTVESAWASPRKLIVLDCDNTLWSGVCGEDGPDGVTISEPHRALQRFMLDQRAEGRLLCLCSRNNEADVRAVFDGRPEMELTMAYVTAYRIGWGDKLTALAELAAELGLAVSSAVFVDDDDVECSMMREQHPDVAVVQVPADPADIPDFLAHQWVFDQFVVTDDDLARADRYAAEQRRDDLRHRIADHEEFLRRCAVEIDIAPIAGQDLERAAQLTARTTQFTTAPRSSTPAQLRQFLDSGGSGWVVRLSDRFGDYGTVGLMLARTDGAVLRVVQLLMSCRVLNRRVEQTMLRFLCERAAELGLNTVTVEFRGTDRNTPARLFLEAATEGPVADGTVEIDVGVPVR